MSGVRARAAGVRGGSAAYSAYRSAPPSDAAPPHADTSGPNSPENTRTSPPETAHPQPARLDAWLSLLRISALCTVPGDAFTGAAAVGARAGVGTLLAAGSSLCLYEAGMVLNDWADRAEDAVERPERPLPSGRIAPPAALAAAAGFTAAGLGLAAAADRRRGPALPVASALAATVWAYDLGLKRTVAGPCAMAAARGLDVLLGAAATRSPAPLRTAAGSAGLLAAHTLAVTGVSREETRGGSARPPLLALGTVATVGAVTARRRRALNQGELGASRDPGGSLAPLGRAPAAANSPSTPTSRHPEPTDRRSAPALRVAGLSAAGLYTAAAAGPLVHAALNPSPPLVQRAVGGGIRAMIPLQAALTARAGAWRTALPLLGLLPLARRLSRKVSPT